MVKTLRRIMMPVLLVFLMSSTAYSFFFGGGPKQKQGASVFGIVIGPSNVNQAGSQYSPIQGATVELRGPKGIINGTTDHMGGFQFQDVPEGEYTLSVNKPGYGSHVEKMSVKNAEIKRVKNIALVPGGGMTTPGGIISPDTVYVAFAKIEENKQSSDTTMWQKAAIMQGADPFALDGNAPPDYSRGMNPYDPGSQVSAHQNTLMTIDPQDVNNLEYVKLDGRPTWLTFNVSGTRLYVATDQNFVLIYDVLHNNILIGSISLPSPATDVKLSPDGKWLFISYSSGGILVADTKTNTPANNITLPAMSGGDPSMPMAIAVSNDGTKLYAALSSMNAGEVVVIDAYTKQPIARAPVGAQPVGMALSPDGTKLFVANHNSASVSVLSTSPLSLINDARVGVSPTKVAVSPDGQRVYITCKGSNNVAVLSGFTGAPSGVISVGKEPMGVAVTGDGSKVYVANHAEGTVSIIDANSAYVIKTTRPQPNSRPYGLAVKP